MQKHRTEVWALAAALSIAGVGTAGDIPLRQTSVIRIVDALDDDLPPAPVPLNQGAAPISPSAESPPIPPSPGIPGNAHPPPSAAPSNPIGPNGNAWPNGQPMPSVTNPALLGMNRWGVMPPPGTLGRTYLRRSTLITDDDHPRKAAVVVHLPEEADVSARGLKVKWTGDVWQLETAQPLVPGVPHIYAIRAKWETASGTVEQTRWVRLIMGRVVDLEF